MTIKMLSKQEWKGLGVQVILLDSQRLAIQGMHVLWEELESWRKYENLARELADVPQEYPVEDIRCLGREVQVTFREVKEDGN